MKNSQTTAERIKSLTKERGISVSKLLSDCDLNKNAIYTMQSNGYYPRAEALIKIAETLDCSVDYLLGRTDTPQIQSNINTGNIGNNNNSSVTISSAAKDSDMTEDFLKIFKKLPFEEKLKIMNYAMDIKNGGDKA